MPRLCGMEGVAGGSLDCSIAYSMTGTMKALMTERAVTGSGDNGAWNVWIDDAGLYRCNFYRYMQLLDVAAFTTKVELRNWLRTWIPEVEAS